MLALAAHPLGLRLRCFDRSKEAPAKEVAELWTGEYTLEELRRFAQGLDGITYEFEALPVPILRALAEELKVPFAPPLVALERAQDRLLEKELFRDLGIPTPPFLPVGSLEELRAALEVLGTPAMLKTRTEGYDGKGQFMLKSPDDLPRAWGMLGGRPLILEGWVAFRRELSILAVRGLGEVAFYPLVENHHQGGILRISRAPAPQVSPSLQAAAEDYARRILEHLDYRGLLALELFETEAGLLANEMAPRVHNSGHWTIEGAETSQFENHLRAILGWPLGSTRPRGLSLMINLLGQEFPPQGLRVPGLHLHWYGKALRPGRKVGHLNLVAESEAELHQRLAQLRSGGWVEIPTQSTDHFA
jgi:5-(carboxyamino)imidazole ribonucleotide synthase